MDEKRRRNVDKKQFAEKESDPPKRKRCLGPDGCKKMIWATKRLRLCTYCRRKVAGLDSEAGFFIEGNGKED